MDISQAKKALKVAAARLTVKKQAADATIARLEVRQTELKDGLAQAKSAGESQLAADVGQALEGIESQLASQLDLRCSIESSLQDTLREHQGADGLKSQLEREQLQATVSQLSTSDPFEPSAEDRALSNAREGISDLQAQVQLDRELGAEARQDRELEGRLRALRSEDPDAAARAQLAELKAARSARPSDGPEVSADEAAGQTPPKKPKRTL